MTLQLKCICDSNQLSRAVRHQWNQLSLPSPMQSADWLMTWWKTYGNEKKNQLCVLLVLDGESLVGVAPWYTRQHWTQGTCLRFLGDGAVCSDHATVVSEPQYIQAVVEIVGQWLHREAGRRWDAIHFESIDRDNRTVHRLIQQITDSTSETHLRDAEGTWAVDLPSTWEAYLSSLSKNHRKRCRRWQRTYFDTGRATVVCTAVADVELGWHEMAQLNQHRRQQLGDRSAFADERFRQFHLSVLPRLLTAEKAELRALHLDGSVVAWEYVFIHEETMFCYQSGMESSERRDGYGNLSTLALFRDAIDRGYTRLDFLRGDEDYKQHWGARRVPCVNYFVASNSLTGTARAACYRAIHSMRVIRNSLVGQGSFEK